MKYDYIIVGAGLFGSVVAYEAVKKGKKVLVVDRRNHIGGNCWTRNEDGINVHEYGAHIFRTNKIEIWEYIRQFAEFNHFINSPIAKYHGKLYNLPFNMNTFYQIWGVTTPSEVKAKIAEQRKEIIGEPQNLEEKAISLVGRDVYEILIKEYTEKQWGRNCRELPASIIRRLPVRLVFDNNYFNDPYQGIPIGGYTQIFTKLLAGCDVQLGNANIKNIIENTNIGKSVNGIEKDTIVLWTGAIDEYFDYTFGPLEYRSLKFIHERHNETDNFQGNAVFNYCDKSVPYTRTIEHKHFEFQCSPINKESSEANLVNSTPFTIVSKEYSSEWQPGVEPYYPVNDSKNQIRYNQYQRLAEEMNFQRKGMKVLFGGRLGTYQYTDMQDTIINALKFSQTI